MLAPKAYQFDGYTWKETDNASPVKDLLYDRSHSDLLAEDPTKYYGEVIEIIPTRDGSSYYLFVKEPFDENQTIPISTAFTIDESGRFWVISIDKSYMDEYVKILGLDEQITTRGIQADAVLNFTKSAYYLQSDVLDFYRWSYFATKPPFFSLDSQKNIWFFFNNKGLIKIEEGIAIQMGDLPVYLTDTETGGVYAWDDGRVWVGGRGVIWEVQDGKWRQLIIPGSSEVLNIFAEDAKGIVYAATDTGIFRFENDTFTYINFVNQNKKPYVYSNIDLSGPDSQYKNYQVTPTSETNNEFINENHYTTAFLEVQEDGSVIYANDHVLAKLQNGQWKSFYFDTFNIKSADINADGKFWLFSDHDGLMSLDADIFEVYQQ